MLKQAYCFKKKKKIIIKPRSWRDVKSRQLPANKTDEGGEKEKKNFASCELLFRVQTQQTLVHNNEPETHVQTPPEESIFKKKKVFLSKKEENPVDSG